VQCAVTRPCDSEPSVSESRLSQVPEPVAPTLGRGTCRLMLSARPRQATVSSGPTWLKVRVWPRCRECSAITNEPLVAFTRWTLPQAVTVSTTTRRRETPTKALIRRMIGRYTLKTRRIG
jgi:hypothetical protein